MYRYLRGRHYLSHADPGTGKCETCGATEHKESNTDAAHRPELPQYIDFLLLWSVASNFASPFFSIYMLENLGLSYFYITVMNMVASVARIAAANLWGRQQTVIRGGLLRWGPFLCWELHISAGDC